MDGFRKSGSAGISGKATASNRHNAAHHLEVTVPRAIFHLSMRASHYVKVKPGPADTNLAN